MVRCSRFSLSVGLGSPPTASRREVPQLSRGCASTNTLPPILHVWNSRRLDPSCETLPRSVPHSLLGPLQALLFPGGLLTTPHIDPLDGGMVTFRLQAGFFEGGAACRPMEATEKQAPSCCCLSPSGSIDRPSSDDHRIAPVAGIP
jgi:hypothetical protein